MMYNYFDEHGFYTHALPHEGVIYSESCTHIELPEEPWEAGMWPRFDKVSGTWSLEKDPSHIDSEHKGMADIEHKDDELTELETVRTIWTKPMRSLFHDGGTKADALEKEYRHLEQLAETLEHHESK